MRLLLVEDDHMIGRSMAAGLEDAGFAVDWVQDGDSADLSLIDRVYDIAILDIGLPRKGGMAVLATLRASLNATPVVIVTARDEVRDRVAGLNAGADDYIVKPFDLDELVARVRAVLRRHVGSASTVVSSGDLRLDVVSRTGSWRGLPVAFSGREFALLEALIRPAGAVLSRRKLEESIYSWDDKLASNAVEVHIHNLRKKLGPGVIKNVRGVGYRLCADVTVDGN